MFPLLVYIMRQPVMTEEVAAEGPFAVVMAPTRELAQQIEARPAPAPLPMQAAQRGLQSMSAGWLWTGLFA